MKPAPLVRGLAATLVLFTVRRRGGRRPFHLRCRLPRPVASGPSKGNPALGKAIFTKNCVVCHKADGTGGVKLTGNPTPNWKDAKTWADPVRAKDDYFRDCITNGKVKSGMVAWGKSGQVKPAGHREPDRLYQIVQAEEIVVSHLHIRGSDLPGPTLIFVDAQQILMAGCPMRSIGAMAMERSVPEHSRSWIASTRSRGWITPRPHVVFV